MSGTVATAVAARVGKGALTRDRILRSAADLFHAQGVNATTLGEVLRASDAGKGQFYQHFEDRDALVQAVLGRHRVYLREHAPPLRSWTDLRAWMDVHVDAMRSFGFRRGCPVGTAAYALQPDQDAARAELRAIFAEMRDRLREFLSAEREAARLRPDADASRLATFCVAAVQGGLLLALVERRPEPVRSSIAEAFKHLQSYIRRPSPRRRA